MSEVAAADIIPKLMDFVYDTSKCKNARGGEQLQWRVTIGFRRFVALSWLMRPEAITAELPAWKVAEAIGISPAHFARISRELSKKLGGLKHPSMRSEAHCQACSRSRKGVIPTTAGKRKAHTSVINAPANRYRAAEQKGVGAAIQAFQDGRKWSAKQRRLLFCAGFIDEDGALTARGIKEIQRDTKGLKDSCQGDSHDSLTIKTHPGKGTPSSQN